MLRLKKGPKLLSEIIDIWRPKKGPKILSEIIDDCGDDPKNTENQYTIDALA